MNKWVILISISTILILILAGFYILRIEENHEHAVQPILFSHKIHAKENQIPCLDCHGSFLLYPEIVIDNPGMPTIEICMECHQQIAGRDIEYDFDGTKINIKNEIIKLRGYREKNEEIPWIKVVHAPDHLHYYHKPHVNSGFECKECHGQVEEMDQVHKIQDFDDNFCISCHEKHVINHDELTHVNECITCRCLFENNKICISFARFYHFLKSKVPF